MIIDKYDNIFYESEIARGLVGTVEIILNKPNCSLNFLEPPWGGQAIAKPFQECFES